MKAGNDKHFDQADNAQGAVDIEGSMLILDERVTQNVNDREELIPDVASVSDKTREVTDGLADTGFFSEAAIKKIEGPDEKGPTAYVATGKTGHHVRVTHLEKKTEPPKASTEASMKEKMSQHL